MKWWSALSLRARIGIGAVMVAFLAFVLFSHKPQPTDTELVDHLKQANIALAQKNDILRAQTATLIISRDQALQERDSIKAISDSATTIIHHDRTLLPVAPPPAALPDAYHNAIAQLDNAILEIARRQELERKAALAQARSDSIIAQKDSAIANLQTMLVNANDIGDDWKRKYTKLNNSQPRCGRKCGMVIGAVGVIATAIGIQHVQGALGFSLHR